MEKRVPERVPKSVLSISYDSSLATTRQMLLEQAGYTVTSAFGFLQAMERCHSSEYDIVLMGHSIPRSEKSALVTVIRQHCDAPILSIRVQGDPPLTEADYSVQADEGPTILLAGIRAILEAREKKAAASVLPYAFKVSRN